MILADQAYILDEHCVPACVRACVCVCGGEA